MEIYKDLSSPASQEFQKLLSSQLSKNKIEEQKSRTKLKREFKKMVEINFVKTREKLILQDKSNTFN